jgi:hypothetical protein
LGPGRGPGLGVGLGSRDSLCGSSGVMSCRHLPFARLLAAHLPRIAAPALAGSSGYSRLDLPSIEAACRSARSELALQPLKRQILRCHLGPWR